MKTKRIAALTVACAMMTCSLGLSIQAGAEDNDHSIRNVIMMIPDGMSVTHTTLARWMKGSDLALDAMASGLVRTYSADAAIADSAPAGTAYASGYKSHTGYVGVLPDANTMPGLPALAAGDARRPVANILESARLAGKGTGLVATCEFMHATPADFSAHMDSRKDYDSLTEQIVYQNVDVLLGGGFDMLKAANRKDREDLSQVLMSRGYSYVENRDALLAADTRKLWGNFAPVDMAYEMDRDSAKQPSLSEMTDKAIATLNKNSKGFFLMVEGSKVDWASHANDPVGVVSDVLAFDKAVETALNFAKKDGHTLVVACADHGNGGLTIGNKSTDGDYDKRKLSDFLAPLQKATRTGEGIEKLLNSDRSNAEEVMAACYGITDLTADEKAAVVSAKKGNMNYVVGPMISRRANLGWTTNGHTGEEVVLYVYHPDPSRQLRGVVENTRIATYMAENLGLDLQATTNRLFVPVKDEATRAGITVSYDGSNPENPVVTLSRGSNTLKLFANKNEATLNGSTVTLEGVVAIVNGRTWAPRQVIDLLK